jgi:hypothetical protein
MGALASPLLACSDIYLVHFHAPVQVYSGMACSIFIAHDRTRAQIDRRKYDAARTVAAFSETIRDEVDLDQLCTRRVAVVDQTMQPAHVSLWLCPPQRYHDKTTRALPLLE